MHSRRLPRFILSCSLRRRPQPWAWPATSSCKSRSRLLTQPGGELGGGAGCPPCPAMRLLLTSTSRPRCSPCSCGIPAHPHLSRHCAGKPTPPRNESKRFHPLGAVRAQYRRNHGRRGRRSGTKSPRRRRLRRGAGAGHGGGGRCGWRRRTRSGRGGGGTGPARSRAARARPCSCAPGTA